VIPMMFPAVAGLFAYYGMGMIYYYFIYNIVLRTPVGWKVILMNCFLITVAEDFVLCILAVMVAVRLRPALGRILAEG
ncbi:MAG: biotin transporter BioY, partial [Clostridiales bacterium]|nr:biotin transporter BioY [Clostridiales bacterium]